MEGLDMVSPESESRGPMGSGKDRERNDGGFCKKGTIHFWKEDGFESTQDG